VPILPISLLLYSAPNFKSESILSLRYINTNSSNDKNERMVEKMDTTLGYLREILSNYSDDHSEGRQIYRKLSEEQFSSEGDFVRQLNQKEINFLNKILPNEINYAKEELDEKRAHELNEVFELLF
jgi:hypothetical protein